jgi:site-specific DNA recombinase
MRRVFRYMRVSTTKQAQRGYSLEAQDTVLRDYAAGHDLEIVEDFVEDESAFTSGKRPIFKAMCDKLRRSATVDTVLCYKLDRMQRNLSDYALLTEKLGVSIISVTEGEVSDTQNQVLGGLHVILARADSQKQSERVSLGMKTKASRGLWPSYAPFGYVNDGELITPDPERAHLIVELFERYVQTDSAITNLVEWAKARGVLTRRAKHISKNGVHKILRNSIYYGPFSWGGVTYKGNHIPLISKQLFNQAQEKLNGRTRHRTSRRFPYKGLLVCGYCGCNLTAEYHPRGENREYIYYRCTYSRGKCAQPRYTQEELSDRLAEVINRIYISREIIETLHSIEQSTAEERLLQRRSRLMGLRSEKQDLTLQQESAYRDKLRGIISENRWLAFDDEISTQLSTIEEKIESITEVRESKWDNVRETLETLQQGPELYRRNNHEFRAQQVKLVALNCIVTAETIDPNYRKPFRVIAEGLEESNWWSQGDLNPRRRDESPLS